MSERSYDRLSRWYDIISGSSEKKLQNYGLMMLDAKDGEQILEIGFGTGHCVVSIARSIGASGRIYGIDISKGMLDITSARVAKVGLSDRVVLKRDDAAVLPFDSGYFDAVFMSFTLELFDAAQIPAILKECKRVLRIGGRICVVAMMCRKEKASIISKFYEWAHSRFPEYVDCRPIAARQELQNAGFVICESKQMSIWSLPVEIVLAVCDKE
ncbi:MAG: methyltransferase domain-containing protein [Peptostreptococcaceae bacterium]|nr:methyltransferase domain-containing protein [Peptostreptococcaceae bacterium]